MIGCQHRFSISALNGESEGERPLLVRPPLVPFDLSGSLFLLLMTATIKAVRFAFV